MREFTKRLNLIAFYGYLFRKIDTTGLSNKNLFCYKTKTNFFLRFLRITLTLFDSVLLQIMFLKTTTEKINFWKVKE